MANCTSITTSLQDLTGLSVDEFPAFIDLLMNSMLSRKMLTCSSDTRDQQNCLNSCRRFITEIFRNMCNTSTKNQSSTEHVNNACAKVVEGVNGGCFIEPTPNADVTMLYMIILVPFVLICLLMACLKCHDKYHTFFKPERGAIGVTPGSLDAATQPDEPNEPNEPIDALQVL